LLTTCVKRNGEDSPIIWKATPATEVGGKPIRGDGPVLGPMGGCPSRVGWAYFFRFPKKRGRRKRPCTGGIN